MVMMGQQLMDSERKKQDDSYMITSRDDYQHCHLNRRNSVEKPKEVPTLASLAARSHQRNVRGTVKSTDDGIKTQLRNPNHSMECPTMETMTNCVENHSNLPENKRVQENGDGPPPTDTAGVYNFPTSGRASSIGSLGAESSSGVGNSLTSSSSPSETIERDVLSPSSEQGDDDGINSNSGSGSCQALLLAEDFNGQMTAAKRFLQMVRNGIKDDEDTRGIRGESQISDDESKVILKESTPGHVPNSKSATGSPICDKEKSDKCPPCVQEVWAHNLLEEFAKIRRIVKHYTFIAMDTEFPGIVVRPQCSVRASGCVFPYKLLKENVDRLKIIQLGVTFMDKHGRTPPICTWQFNFKFSLNTDMYASDSISLLTRCGIQFEKHAEEGIDPLVFGEYFISSGMVLEDQVTYLTFHSGFDFGYLIKLLSNLPLPENEESFFDMMRIYFPVVYDLKFLMKSMDLHGGLQDIANQMGQQRVGTQHQAGSDSLLTGKTFFKLQAEVFSGEIDASKYCGKLYGFQISAEDGRDEWSEDAGDLIDPTSPKPLISRNATNNNIGNNTNIVRESHVSASSHSSNTTGEIR